MRKMNANVQVLPRAEGIKAAYELSLGAQNLDVVCLSSAYASVIGDYFDRDYAPRLSSSGVRTREILPDTAGNRRDSRKKDGVKNQVRFLTKSRQSESDFLLFDDTVILVSYDVGNPYAVVVRDVAIVANLRTQFETLWDKLKK